MGIDQARERIAEKQRRSTRLGKMLNELPAAESNRLIAAYACEVERLRREERHTIAAAEREAEQLTYRRAEEQTNHGPPMNALDRSYALVEAVVRKNPIGQVKLSEAMRQHLMQKRTEGTLPPYMEALLQ